MKTRGATVYGQIKSKVLTLTPDSADIYIAVMYNAGVITVSQFLMLDKVIFKMRCKLGEFD